MKHTDGNNTATIITMTTIVFKGTVNMAQGSTMGGFSTGQTRRNTRFYVTEREETHYLKTARPRTHLSHEIQNTDKILLQPARSNAHMYPLYFP